MWALAALLFGLTKFVLHGVNGEADCLTMRDSIGVVLTESSGDLEGAPAWVIVVLFVAWTVTVVVVSFRLALPAPKQMKDVAMQVSAQQVDSVDELTIDAVREKLRALEASTQGNKAELVDRLVSLRTKSGLH